MRVRIGASSTQQSFKKRAGIESGPAAFEASISCINLNTPFTSIDMSVMSGICRSSKGGSDNVDVGVKTQEK